MRRRAGSTGARRLFASLIACAALTPAPAAENVPRSTGRHWEKVHPQLRNNASDSQEIEVAVSIREGADLGGFLRKALRRPLVGPMGLQLVVGWVRVDDIEKVAHLPAVVEVRPAAGLFEPPPPPDPDLPDRHRERPDRPGRVSTKDWYEATDVHRFRQAWDDGYSGRGVRVMINDSGIDFCHPDLLNTWATVDDQSSPYSGWPLMFDAHSMYLLARDQRFGESNIASGRGHYADTTATCTEGGPCSFRPIGSGQTFTYTLPGTSVSGTYRIGSHPDTSVGSDDARAAVLLADETREGVFDAVYVDLNKDHDFTNDPVATVSSPAACGTYGVTSYSGGLVYFIADGVNPVPASDWFWELDPPGNGDLVAFIIDDANESGSGHGTKCASAVAAQGVVNGGAPPFKPEYQGPGDGMVLGVARDARLVAVGNTYNNPGIEDPFLMAALGYDGVAGTADDCQIVSNSWGNSTVDNDGWDLASRLIDSIQQELGPNLSVLFSAGNGGPGYGTLGPPAPPAGILVAASTEMGSTGWDVVDTAEQIRWGDLIPFSSRGPEMRGTSGVHVAAVGAYAAGDITVNESSDDVEEAWTTWGGTSRACPVAAGHMALVYDAYRQANGVWPTTEVAKAILMAGAVDLHHDPFNQGAGMVDAVRSAAIAAGDGGRVFVLPPAWAAGDYRGGSHPAFANIVFPNQQTSATFTVTGTGGAATFDVSAERLVQVGEASFELTTTSYISEASYDFDSPNYLVELTDMIPPDTDLVVVRTIHPLDELDHDGDLNADNMWRLLLYDWTDDGDGTFWNDANGNGTVNPGELDGNDAYVRYSYSRLVGTSQEVRVQRPLDRMHDGIWLGLQHHTGNLAIPQTHFEIRLEFYRRQAWGWVSAPSSVSVPAGGNTTFEVNVTVPGGAEPGLHEGSLWLDDGSERVSVPITVSVAAQLGDEPLVFGGASGDTPFKNGSMRGLFNWTSRAYDGDWRLFFFDVPAGPSADARLLFKTTWQDPPLTDIDTIVLGPVSDPDFSGEDPARYGPYRLEEIARSPYWRYGEGTWGYNTSTGGSEDWIDSSLGGGLHAVLLHNVLTEGSAGAFEVPFTVSTKWFNSSSGPIEVNSFLPSGSIRFVVETGSTVDGLSARAFGLACEPEVTEGSVVEDGEYVLEIPVENSGRLEVVLDGQSGNDLDLTLYDPNGQPTLASSSSGPDERITIGLPADGTWQARVLGYNVPGSSATFELSVDSIEGPHFGRVAAPAGPIAAGVEVPIEVRYTMPVDAECDEWRGLLFYGPPGGEVIEVPITIVSEAQRQGSRRVSP